MNCRTDSPRLFAVTLAVAGTAWLFVVGGQTRVGAAEAAKTEGPWQHLARDYISLPGVYWSLGRKSVRDEVGITAEQTEQLKEISRKFTEASRPATGPGDWAKLAPEERRQKYAEMMAENRKRMGDFSKQVQEVLTADQKEKLEMIDIRQHVLELLLSAPTAAKLGLSDEQRGRLRKNREACQAKTSELQRQIQKLHDQAGQAALELLTPDQIEKLKRMLRGGGAVLAPKK